MAFVCGRRRAKSNSCPNLKDFNPTQRSQTANVYITFHIQYIYIYIYQVPNQTGICLACHLNSSNSASSPFSAAFVTPRNGLSLASHTVPSDGNSPVWKYLRIYRAMHRLGELIMQWPSESASKTTEPGHRDAIACALWVLYRQSAV